MGSFQAVEPKVGKEFIRPVLMVDSSATAFLPCRRRSRLRSRIRSQPSKALNVVR